MVRKNFGKKNFHFYFFFYFAIFREGHSAVDVYRMVVAQKKMHPIPQETPSELKSLITLTLSYEANSRPTFAELHNSLSKINQCSPSARYPLFGKGEAPKR